MSQDQSGDKTGITLLPHECEAIAETPDALMLLADWHEVQLTQADALNDAGIYDAVIKFHEGRKAELRAEAKRLHEEYGTTPSVVGSAGGRSVTEAQMRDVMDAVRRHGSSMSNTEILGLLVANGHLDTVTPSASGDRNGR